MLKLNGNTSKAFNKLIQKQNSSLVIEDNFNHSVQKQKNHLYKAPFHFTEIRGEWIYNPKNRHNYSIKGKLNKYNNKEKSLSGILDASTSQNPETPKTGKIKSYKPINNYLTKLDSSRTIQPDNNKSKHDKAIVYKNITLVLQTLQTSLTTFFIPFKGTFLK